MNPNDSRENLLAEQGGANNHIQPCSQYQYGSSESEDEHDGNFLKLLQGQSRVRGQSTKNSTRKRRPKVRWYKRHPFVVNRPSVGPSLQRWKRWLLLIGILVGGLLAIVATGGIWIYRTAPPYGMSPPWYPTPRGGSLPEWQDAYQKAEVMVRKMSLAEKVNVTTGTGWMMGLCVGNTGPALHSGFPSLCLQDGPLGIRYTDHITAFPAGITTGATWSRDLMYKRGRMLGLEARLKGINVILGPAVGPLGKHPAGGRNWEGFGADPVLQGIAAAETIRGIQDEGVIATVKHFLLNEQEHFRQPLAWGLPNAMTSIADDRTLHELYLWPFSDSIRAHVGSVMCSYQMVNYSYACGNSKLLNGILKDELGFQGFVQSDWLASRSGISDALAGLDMTMPGDGLTWANGRSLWGSKLTEAVLNTSLPISRLNDMATRIVATWFKLNQDDTSWSTGGPNFSSWTNETVGLLYPGSGDNANAVVNQFVNVQGHRNESHGLLVRQIAAEGTVLLKNEDDTLPLSADNWHSQVHGGEGAKIRVAVFGQDAGANSPPNGCVDRGCNEGTLASGWGSGAVDFPYLVTPLEALRRAINPEKVDLTSFPSNKVPSRQQSAFLKSQDVCIVFVNADSGEGYITYQGIRGDRNDLFVQKGGDKLVASVAKDCGEGKGRTIVVIHAVGPVVMEGWVDLGTVKAIILANLPGQESGNALVDVLFGRMNPSGKLPYTIGRNIKDYGPGGQILYYPNGVIPKQNFTVRMYIDYRHFDKYNVEPRYEFGYGLSYTKFRLNNISATLIKPKSKLPAPRPAGVSPPTYNDDIPSAQAAVYPAGLRRLEKYVYPYLDWKTIKNIKQLRYPYPDGYDVEQPPSAAGGGEGGNPSLWDVHAEVTTTLTNIGARAGKEVVQLYVSFPDNVPVDDSGSTAEETGMVDFPVKVLREFTKVDLQPGESEVVTFRLTRRDLSYWSVRDQNWVMPTQGKFKIQVGNSSRSLPLAAEL